MSDGMDDEDDLDAPDEADAAAEPEAGGRHLHVQAHAADAGARIDRWLAAALPELSRARIQALIADDRVSIAGGAATSLSTSDKVKAGATYVIEVPAPRPAAPVPEAMDLAILYEDADVIVIDKPAGLSVHPAPGHWSGTLVHALLHHCAGGLSGIGGVERPGIVHRIDKDTSGVLVAAKSDAAHQGLSAQFAAHTIDRLYLAVCRGAPRPREGVVDAPLARSSADRRKQAVTAPSSGRGKHAVTHYRVMETFGQAPGQSVGAAVAALVEARLETGRTHQIRAHLAHIGHPLIGDPLYGKQRRMALGDGVSEADAAAINGFERQALHAAHLGFIHPVTQAPLAFDAPLPADLLALIEALGRL